MSGKITLAFVDRLLIGVIAAVVVMFFNWQFGKREILRDHRVAVSQVESRYLNDLRGELMDLIREYETSVRQVIADWGVSHGEIGALEDVAERFRNIVLHMAVVDSCIEVCAEPVIGSIEGINRDLYSILAESVPGARSGSTIESIRDTRLMELTRQYRRFLAILRQALVDAVTRDLNGGGGREQCSCQ
jgi:hypothetical protein